MDIFQRFEQKKKTKLRPMGTSNSFDGLAGNRSNREITQFMLICKKYSKGSVMLIGSFYKKLSFIISKICYHIVKPTNHSIFID